MIATYEAPALRMYGRVAALTNSAKCTPGSDAAFAAADAHIVVDANNPIYTDNTPMQFLGGGLVPTGTECINLFDGSTFTAN